MARDYKKEFKNHCLTCVRYDLASPEDSTQRGFRCEKHMRPMAFDENCSSYGEDKLRSNSMIEAAVNWRLKKGYSPSPDKGHWYVTTAICNILGYGEDCEYMQAFDIMQSTYMREDAERLCDLLKYEVYGPAIAWELDKAYEDPKRKRGIVRLAQEILEPEYLTLILGLIKAGNLECAILAYKQMIDMLAQRFGIFLEELQYTPDEWESFDIGSSRRRMICDCSSCPLNV